MTQDEIRREVIADLGRFTHDPLSFVLWAFPWGVDGTSLANEQGPDEWQREQLQAIGRRLKADPHTPLQDATASGHGVGKSCQVAWLILWSLMTYEHCRGVITANTEGQLRSKTWPELAKWYAMLQFACLREMFSLTATALHATDPGHERNWRVDAIPWSEQNTEAFAGLHNAGKRVLILLDEASSIADGVWDTASGGLTDADTEILWLVYGNPTRNTGRFYEAVEGRFRNIWTHRAIDSRTVKRTNSAQLECWIAAYGEDSDFVRVRVKGEFPRSGSLQFIAGDVVDEAMAREAQPTPSSAVIFGVDVARYGDDKSVLAVRQGHDARAIPWLEWAGHDAQRDLMRVAGDIAEYARKYFADAIFVDKGAMGAGLVDRLNQLNVRGVIPIDFGGKGGKVTVGQELSIETTNKRTHMWASMREWLSSGTIPDDAELRADLTGVEYGFGADQVAYQLERKVEMKKRGLASPDKGDALALTFAAHVERKLTRDSRPLPRLAYDPYAELMG